MNLQVSTYEYPPAVLGLSGLASDTFKQVNITGKQYGNGAYTISVSSTYPVDSNLAYLFDKRVASNEQWMSGPAYDNYGVHGEVGAHIGHTQTAYAKGMSYSGEWVQMQLPYPIAVLFYDIAPMIVTGVHVSARGPKAFALFGSNTGVKWVMLDNRTNVSDWSTAGMYKQFRISGAGSYSHYRLCIGKTQGTLYASVTALSEWKLYSSEQTTDPTMVKTNLAASLQLEQTVYVCMCIYTYICMC
jgi:hypothetical protein